LCMSDRRESAWRSDPKWRVSRSSWRLFCQPKQCMLDVSGEHSELYRPEI